MPVKMHQIFYFVALCEEQSFTRAAKRCGVAQPSLTRAIQTLEEEFGAQLFERSRSNVRLTQLGLLVRPDFERISQATTVLAQKITELKAASPSKPNSSSMEASMRATLQPSRQSHSFYWAWLCTQHHLLQRARRNWLARR